jgi:hypothetical protein
MPQITKGGKYIFGWSLVRLNGRIQIPFEAQDEYHLVSGENVILISGSKTTGGFSVTTKTLIQQSELLDVLVSHPELAEYQLREGEAIKYKGRLYSWVGLRQGGILKLSSTALLTYEVKHGDYLLVIRGSNIAFVMGAKGPLIEKAKQHIEIPVFG